MKNIYTNSKPFYLLSKALGLFPLSYVGAAAKGNFEVKWKDVTITAFSFSLLLSLVLRKISLLEPVLIDSKILVKSWEMSLEVGLILTLIQFCYQVSKRNQAKQFLQQVNAFDEQIQQMGIKIDHEKHEVISYGLTFSLVVLNTIFFITLPMLYVHSGFVIKLDFFIGCGYAYISLYKFFFAFQFCVAALTIRERFRILNENLRVSSFNKNLEIFTVVKDRNSLKLFSKLYLDLCDGIEAVNSTFTFQLIYVSISSVVLTLFSAFGIIHELSRRPKFSYFGLLPHIFIIVIQYCREFIIVYSGSEATKEAGKTSAIVARLMNNEDADVNGFHAFLSQIRARNLNFQTIFYNVNWKLLMAITSSIATYLVITCQFDTSK